MDGSNWMVRVSNCCFWPLFIDTFDDNSSSFIHLEEIIYVRIGHVQLVKTCFTVFLAFWDQLFRKNTGVM